MGPAGRHGAARVADSDQDDGEAGSRSAFSFLDVTPKKLLLRVLLCCGVIQNSYPAAIAKTGLSVPEFLQAQEREAKEVARQLRESTKELCRNLKGNPNIAENLSKIQTERSNLQNLLSKTLRELRTELLLVGAEQPVGAVRHVQVGVRHRDDRQPAALRLDVLTPLAVRWSLRAARVECLESARAGC